MEALLLLLILIIRSGPTLTRTSKIWDRCLTKDSINSGIRIWGCPFQEEALEDLEECNRTRTIKYHIQDSNHKMLINLSISSTWCLSSNNNIWADRINLACQWVECLMVMERRTFIIKVDIPSKWWARVKVQADLVKERVVMAMGIIIKVKAARVKDIRTIIQITRILITIKTLVVHNNYLKAVM